MSDKETSKKTHAVNDYTQKQGVADSPAAEKKETDSTATSKDLQSKPEGVSSKTPETKATSPVSKGAKSNAIHTKNNSAVKAKAPAKQSNKLIIATLVIASVSIFTSIGHYVWQQQNSYEQLSALSQQNNRAIEQSRAQLKSKLTSEFNKQLLQQQQKADKLLQQSINDNDSKLQRLTAQVTLIEKQVEQSDPSDWLVHEAEYLVRIAARTMWLERDTKAAINLLREADERLKSLNQSKFLPVRALINEDIEALGLMPTLENQEAILSLMALNKQVSALPLTNFSNSQANKAPEEDLVLSDDWTEWPTNLYKTWRRFFIDFIRINRREGSLDPLLTPEEQQHLKQNLSLKLQLATWAASEQKSDIYKQTLLDIQEWLNKFFDMSLPANINFHNSIEQLKSKTIYFNYPSDLKSLSAMKRLLSSTSPNHQTSLKKNEIKNSDKKPAAKLSVGES